MSDDSIFVYGGYALAPPLLIELEKTSQQELECCVLYDRPVSRAGFRPALQLGSNKSHRFSKTSSALCCTL